MSVKSYRGPPMALGNAAPARVRLIVWCKDCRHQIEPDPAEMAQRYGAATSVLDWRQRLVCSKCGGRQINDFSALRLKPLPPLPVQGKTHD
jgi:hypothetical protein